MAKAGAAAEGVAARGVGAVDSCIAYTLQTVLQVLSLQR